MTDDKHQLAGLPRDEYIMDHLDDESWLVPPDIPAPAYWWCRCENPIALVYSEAAPGYICDCGGIIPDDVMRDSK